MAIYKEIEWTQPLLTSPTSYGTCTDSRNNTSERQEGWRALDGQSGTDFSPAREGGWWKWVVPDTLIFIAGTSTIVVTSGSPATAMDIQFFADEAATKPLTEVVTLPSTVGANTTIPVINTETTNTIYMTIAAHSNWSEINEISFVNVLSDIKDVSGSVKISKGYYSDGLNKIIMPTSTYNIDTLMANQTTGGKNKLFAYTDSTDSVGALITSTTPTGSFKITKDLEHPVYLDPTKNYIAGGELVEPEISYMSGSGELWERPNLTSNTSYGVVSDIDNSNSDGTHAPWKALDGNTSTYASLRDSSVAAGSPFWWKWVLPHNLVFNSSSILKFVQRDSGEGCSGWRFYADVEMTKPLTDTFSSQVSSGSTVTLPCSSLTGEVITDTIYLYNASSTSWPGMAELQFENVYRAGESSVSSTKALQYSEAQDTTYWIPSEATVTLSSVKATQSVGPVNDLYLTTTIGTPTASLSFSDNGEIGGVTTKLPLKQKVYLNNATDKILGAQERPDEISINVSTGGISASGWSALYSDVTGFTGNTALDFTTPVDIPASSLDIPAGYGSYLAYLYYINGDIKCVQAGDTVLDKAVFTGYALNISDGAIQSVSKQGELCAAFTQRGYGRNTRRYLFIPSVNLKEGSFTTKAASGFYDMSVQGTLPPDNMIASMQNIEYNSSAKTVVMDGNTFDYIGDMMCTLI